MVEKAEVKPDDLNFDDLLQCPVCYEIPTGQIFQCNEGHHVCGQCKTRLDVCPVCRALFFGTRNYAMEELISNIRKMRSFKLGGTSGSGSSSSSTPAKDNTSAEHENNVNENEDDEEDNNSNVIERPVLGPPQPCRGLFRCLCCKPGQAARLPAARLLNHLRYFHAPHLLEGRSENGEYLQAWQFATVPGKLVTAVRISDMGIFFLTIEIQPYCVSAWLSMAAATWVAHKFNYTISICGNDREAIFSDSVWTVRSCEGTLKKQGHCLIVRDQDALALTSPDTISGKLTVRRMPVDQLPLSQPRAVLRIANRVNSDQNSSRAMDNQNSWGDDDQNLAFRLEPFLYELQNDVTRLSRAFATLGREADSLIQSEAEMNARIQAIEQAPQTSRANADSSDSEAEPSGTSQSFQQELSLKARRNMRMRMLAAFGEPTPPVAPSNNNVQAPFASNSSTQNVFAFQPRQNTPQYRQNGPTTQMRQNTPANQLNQNTSTELRQSTSATQARIQAIERAPQTSRANARSSDSEAEPSGTSQSFQQELSLKARRNMRMRMLAALDEPTTPVAPSNNNIQAPSASNSSMQNVSAVQPRQNRPQYRQNGPTTQMRQNTPATQLNQNTSTELRQSTSATRLRQYMSTTQVGQNSAAAQPQQNTSAAQPRQNTSATTQPRQNTSATQLRPSSAAVQPRTNSVATQPRPNSATTQPRQNNAVSQPRQYTPQSTQNEVHFIGLVSVVAESAPVGPAPAAPSTSTSTQHPVQQSASASRNKKKRRQRARR